MKRGWVLSLSLATVPHPRSPIPMCRIPIVRWIANAAARFSGRYGAITRQAEVQRCSRQTVYNHASLVVEGVRAEYTDGPARERLLRENQELRLENDQL